MKQATRALAILTVGFGTLALATSPAQAETPFVAGTNELIVEVQNIAGGDAGCLGFRMDLVVDGVPVAVASDSTWTKSTYSPGVNASCGVDTLPPWDGVPDASTFTLTQPFPGNGLCTSFCNVWGCSNIPSNNGTRYYRTTFTLPQFSVATADVRLGVDNAARVVINGQDIVYEDDCTGANWSATSPPHATIDASGALTILNLFDGPLSADSDGDGVTDDIDNCPNDANSDQADLDGDGSGDACDADADGDGDPSGADCDDLDPARYAGATELCADGIDNNCNGLVDQDDVGGDCDGDGVGNGSDNCPLDYNPGQEDLDADGAGNACDNDDDGDGVDDLADNCPTVANGDQADYDGDGAGDACDADGDGDGVDDAIDMCHFSAPSDLDAGVPSRGLGKNRWADIDGNGTFDTTGNNPTGRSFTMDETLGCGCAQIIDICGYGNGHSKFGCSNSVMDTWTGTFDEAGGPVGVCK